MHQIISLQYFSICDLLFPPLHFEYTANDMGQSVLFHHNMTQSFIVVV